MRSLPPGRLRVLLSIHHPLDADSGAAGVVMRLGDEYQRLGHEVRIASHDDLPARLAGPIRDLLFPVRLASIVRAWRPDVVDASSGDAWIAHAVGGPDGPLRVTHSHGLEHLASAREIEEAATAGAVPSVAKRFWRHGLRLRLVARSFRQADLSLVLNRAEADFLQRRLHVPPRAVRLLRLATDHAGRPAETGPRDPQAVVQIGAYTRRKGVEVTAAAMTRVMRRFPLATMTFVGTGCARDTVVADYPPALHSRIEVVRRYVNGDLPRLLVPRSICLMPSMFEGYGLAKLEAMACGLAMVVSDDPGASADVVDGGNGFVVARGDVDDLARSVSSLLADPGRVETFGRAGMATAARFTWPAVAAERLDLYRRHAESCARNASAER